ncbi:hypothetical protein FQN54_001200 [Arachnomyces sp. PD_36]|nr:hypothetical protein FQN54_001200 [Arachnomyces sp. PD_36]
MTDAIQEKGVKLPPELTEQILSTLVDEHEDNPAQHWALRHLSHHQKRRIEQHFCDYWLPKLIVTIYGGAWTSIDYKLTGLEKSSPITDGLNDVAHFQASEDLDSRIRQEYLKELWDGHSVESPKAHLRLGEGLLNDGFKGGYIVNDTEIPHLKVDESGTNIRFDWRGAFDALLREEIMLRKIHDEMIAEKTAKWRLENDWPELKAIPSDVYMAFLCSEIQMQRRVAARKHRIHRYDPSGETKPPFHKLSQHLHGQTATLTDGMPDGGCFCCNRKAGPDIFEVITKEESMVLLYPGWKSLDLEALVDLYAEEFGWQCCLVQNSRDREFQKKRKDMWKTGSRTIESLKGIERWDILG